MRVGFSQVQDDLGLIVTLNIRARVRRSFGQGPAEPFAARRATCTCTCTS